MWQYTDGTHTTVSRVGEDGGVQFRTAKGLVPETILAEQPSERRRAVASPWQLRKALNAVGLREAVEAALVGASLEVKDAWAVAEYFESDHPLLLSLGGALGKTPDEIYELILFASTL